MTLYAAVVGIKGVGEEEKEEMELVVVGRDGDRTFWGKGRRRKGGGGASVGERKLTEAEWKRWKRERAKGEEDAAAKGGDGMPVNSCTMARKLDVSVVSTVVGARREALERFFELRDPAAAVAVGTGCCTDDIDDDDWQTAAAVQLEESR